MNKITMKHAKLKKLCNMYRIKYLVNSDAFKMKF